MSPWEAEELGKGALKGEKGGGVKQSRIGIPERRVPGDTLKGQSSLNA